MKKTQKRMCYQIINFVRFFFLLDQCSVLQYVQNLLDLFRLK